MRQADNAMMISIANILDRDALTRLRAALDQLAFVDGRSTAGWSAAEVKRNRQAAPSAALRALQDEVEKAIGANAVFQIAARPKQVGPILFARYSGGETYGDAWAQFMAWYYLFALVFVIFDIEAVFLFPWAVAYGGLGFYALLQVGIFIFLLFDGLVYAWRTGALKWQ